MADSPSRRSVDLLWLLTLAAWWLGLFLRLGRMWNAQTEYAYGWAVPFLATWLFIPRWRNRPAPQPCSRSARMGLMAAIGLSGLILVTGLPVLEANPLWPLLLWPSVGAAVALTLGFLGLQGGMPWIRHFAFPVAFIFTALPWPAIILQPVTLALMHVNATLAAEVVSTLGRPAVVHGNVIEISTGMVGVDEACSGLRSLQSILMVMLFFGEFYGLTWRKRAQLITGGFLIALVSNLARTTFLTWKVANEGLDAMARWHDIAGYVELGVSLVAVWTWTTRLDQKHPVEDDGATVTPAPSWSGRFSWWLPGTLLAFYLITELGTQVWYGWHERQRRPGASHWSLQITKPNAQTLEITATTRDILRCDSAEGYAWPVESGVTWGAYFFRWKGDMATRGLPEVHTPEVCLPAAGVRLSSDLGFVTVPAAGDQLVFHQYKFNDNGRDYYVFFCLWDYRDGKPVLAQGAAKLTAYRLGYVREGRRTVDLGQLEFTLYGVHSEAEAVKRLQAMVPTVVMRAGG